MVETLIVLSSILTFIGVFPYARDILRGKTKPRVVTWFVWSVLTGIAAIASYVDQQYPAAILAVVATAGTATIVVLGYKNGDRKFERIDFICLAGAGIGLILWWYFNSPAIAIIASITIDFIGAVPTLIHSWKKPHEETWIVFLLSFLGALCTVAVVTDWRVTAIAYPLYLTVINLVFTVLLVTRRRYAVVGQSVEIREL